MATYEIQCHETMCDSLFVETSKRRAMRRAKAYAGEGLLGQARVDVRIMEPTFGRRGGYQLGADGKVRRVS